MIDLTSSYTSHPSNRSKGCNARRISQACEHLQLLVNVIYFRPLEQFFFAFASKLQYILLEIPGKSSSALAGIIIITTSKNSLHLHFSADKNYTTWQFSSWPERNHSTHTHTPRQILPLFSCYESPHNVIFAIYSFEIVEGAFSRGTFGGWRSTLKRKIHLYTP